jgi:hypothetical protein
MRIRSALEWRSGAECFCKPQNYFAGSMKFHIGGGGAGRRLGSATFAASKGLPLAGRHQATYSNHALTFDLSVVVAPPKD